MIQALIFPLALLMGIIIVATQAYPSYQSAKEIKDTKIESAKEEREKQKEISSNLIKLKDNISKNAASFDKVNVAVPIDSNIEEILIKVQILFDEEGIEYEELSIEDEGASEMKNNNNEKVGELNNITPIRVSSSIVAPYDSIKNLLVKLQNLDRLSNVNSLSLEFQSKMGEGEFSFDFMMAEIEMEFYKKSKPDKAIVEKSFDPSASGAANGTTSAATTTK